MTRLENIPTDSQILFAAAEVASAILFGGHDNVYLDDRSGCKELNHIPFCVEGIEFLERHGGLSLKDVYKCVEKIEPTPSLPSLLTHIISECKKTYEEKDAELGKAINRVNEMVGFNLSSMTTEINSLKNTLDSVKGAAEKIPELHPMLSRIDIINRHFGIVSKVVNEYDSIFKAIVKPLQRSGEEGIEATKRWAVISVVLSAVISTLASIAITFYFQAPTAQEERVDQKEKARPPSNSVLQNQNINSTNSNAMGPTHESDSKNALPGTEKSP